MSWTLTNKGGGGGSEKPPVGNHLAVMVGVFDMGTQLDDFDPAKPKWQHQAFFVWELVGEQIAGTKKNHVIGAALTFSLNEKSKLAKWVAARTGKPIPQGASYDVLQELGQPCLLNVVDKNGYPRVDGMAAVPKGLPVPPATYTPTAVSLEQFLQKTPIPEWCPWHFGSPLADHIAACKEIGGQKPRAKAKAGDPAQPQAGGLKPDGTPAAPSDPIPW